MRHSLFFAIAIALTALPVIAHAQDVAGLAEARTVTQCVHAQDEQMQRLMRLIEQAEQRAARPGVAADVRRDAIASIAALVDRIRSHAQQARQCVEQSRIPVRVDGVVVETAPADPAHDSLAADRGTVPVIERDTVIAPQLTVVRGERVDGTGAASEASVRDAVRGIGPSLVACYDAYLDRGARRSGDVHLTFTASAGGRVSGAAVERGGPFDAAMSQCVQRAASSMMIAGQRGRSVYSYVLRFATP
ncbi:MAG: hypothetical protein M3Y87_32610 [Myxococcota bacterium]|nr:hypothetical protein [Myxococcota bacterium]